MKAEIRRKFKNILKLFLLDPNQNWKQLSTHISFLIGIDWTNRMKIVPTWENSQLWTILSRKTEVIGNTLSKFSQTIVALSICLKPPVDGNDYTNSLILFLHNKFRAMGSLRYKNRSL